MVQDKGRRGGAGSLLVEPYRQIKLGLVFLMLNLIFACLIFAVFGYYVFDIYQAMTDIFNFSGQETSQILAKFQTPIVVGAALIVLFVILTLVVSVRYTHQIYGPLVSIQRFLDQLIGGEKPKPIKLRNSDQLKGLAERLNSIALQMNKGMEKPMLSKIESYVDSLLSEKKVEKLTIRDGDPYGELVEKLNKLADQYSK